jgi:hypothetical protein
MTEMITTFAAQNVDDLINKFGHNVRFTGQLLEPARDQDFRILKTVDVDEDPNCEYCEEIEDCDDDCGKRETTIQYSLQIYCGRFTPSGIQYNWEDYLDLERTLHYEHSRYDWIQYILKNAVGDNC